ncbi:unnamed protein product [Danaus chrysippus]|uniref:(African queen) hypothetical protein n=1 Tax=Danaus chrysippus TaxID=151541 RepID=A0A8J2W8V0_9NEOP|nr:unnamed protein product [Danaus chrysippus]
MSNLICEVCVKSLRDAHHFRQKVLYSEEQLMKRITEIETNKKLLVVKSEPIETDDNDSDNYFLASTIKNESPSPIQKIVRKVNIKSKKKEHLQKNLKNLVNKLAINSCDKKQMKKDIKVMKGRKLTIKKDIEINLTFTNTRLTQDKQKHRENLLTILKYSNATPFKDKSLLGFICGYCNASYPDPTDLKNHTDLDHIKERLDFKSSFDMTEYNVKLDVVNLMCTLCDEKMENLFKLRDHLIKIHNKVFHRDIKDHLLQFKLKKGDVFDCALCPSTYETFKMLKQHMNKHYCNYSCSKCENSFATKRSLNTHQTTHEEGSFKCDHCDKIFSTKTKKQYHEKTKHLGARNISNCPYCDVPFRSYYQRNQHLVKVHNSEAQYKCNVCSKGYILKSLLMCHIKKNHLMERNCQCTECGYKFFSKKALKAHMIKHSGERKFICEVCHKSYARKYTLREHMRIHNDDRRFKCDICGTAFIQKCSLKSHLLSHHGISLAASDIPIS